MYRFLCALSLTLFSYTAFSGGMTLDQFNALPTAKQEELVDLMGKYRTGNAEAGKVIWEKCDATVRVELNARSRNRNVQNACFVPRSEGPSIASQVLQLNAHAAAAGFSEAIGCFILGQRS